MTFNIIGAGLAGCEAALYIARAGFKVRLFEMKPLKYSSAHKSPLLSELVCSNSLKSESGASGLLKNEMRAFGSAMLSAADASRVPAGGSLSVDREAFARIITDRIFSCPNITVVSGEVTEIPDGTTIIATGPLTAGGLADRIAEITGNGNLYFFDAAAPIITAESVDYSAAFAQSRYDKGGADYINCPMDKDEYLKFVTELIAAERAPLHEGEEKYFEGCMPIEVMATRGIDAIRFGPLKPVGLTNPRTGRRPYAAVQLRKENAPGSLFNLVGFQTNLRFGEQERVFRLIPALKDSEFVKFGVMHRNTFIDAPRCIDRFLRLKNRLEVFVCGQLCGVEGYAESAATGLLAAFYALRTAIFETPEPLGAETMLGALVNYITLPNKNFQPMNANFGIIAPLSEPVRDKQARADAYYERSRTAMANFLKL